MYAVKRTRAPGTTGIRTSVPAGPAGGVARALPAP
jgi:hypothetical protein